MKTALAIMGLLLVTGCGADGEPIPLTAQKSTEMQHLVLARDHAPHIHAFDSEVQQL